MKQVKSFQTTDGQLFQEEMPALTHELGVTLRALIRQERKNPNASHGIQEGKATMAANFIAHNAENLLAHLIPYRDKMRRIARRESGKSTRPISV